LDINLQIDYIQYKIDLFTVRFSYPVLATAVSA